MERVGLLHRYTDFLLIMNSMYKVPRILLGISVRELHRYIRSTATTSENRRQKELSLKIVNYDIQRVN